MEIVNTVVGKIVEQITEHLMRSMGRQIGYLVHYKENIEKLEEEIEKLGDEQRRVQGRVDEARNNGEIIEDDVWKWLTKVHGMKEEVDIFLADQVQEHKRCYNFSSRYKVSKEAKTKTDVVIKLKDDGKFERIAHPAPPPEFGFQSSEDYVTFDSRASIFNTIMEALKDNSVNLIGIYGIGGVGKTTMVIEVGKQVEKDGAFDVVVMAVVSQNMNVRNIQGQLADKLVLRLQAETEDGRAGELWNRLNNGKQNLVILDDVWQELNLKAIGIPIKGGCNCKVVLTSRNQGVCQKMQVQKYFSLGVLSPQESWALFKKMVGNSVNSPKMHSIAEEVCKECGNLPVAILAVAAALKDKNEHVWADALQQLRDSMLKNIEGVDTRVYSSLELSYNHLQSRDAKWCFLLCCLFPEDAEISIDDLVRYGLGMRLLENADTLERARNRVHVLVDTLKISCLLLASTRDENKVKMHDVIRDVAISIAKDKEAFLVKQGVCLEEWPEKDAYECCKVISLRCKNIDKLPDELECVELHTLVLEWSNPSTKIPDAFFNGIRKLRVLDLNSLHIRSLPSSLTNLSNLRILCLRGCELSDISILKDLENLEMLSLGGSNIKKLAPEIRYLTRLRLLDLKNCYNLKVIPPNVISSLYRLEELYIPRNFDQWEVEATNNKRSAVTVVELNSLTHLISLEIHIPKHVTFLPKEIPFEKLTRFKISVGSSLEYDEDYSLTRVLKLAGILLKDEFKDLLERTEVLYLNQLKGLEKSLHSRYRGEFLGLKILEVKDCDGIEYLFSPSIARGLVQLRQLKISRCKMMEEIIGNDQRQREGDEVKVVFPQLKIMKLSELPSLRSFYARMMTSSTKEGNPSTPAQSLFNEKVTFPALKRLEITRLEHIREIWDNQLVFPAPKEEKEEESFSQLRYLIVTKCDKLVNVVPANVLPRLQNLKALDVKECKSVLSLVEVLNVEDSRSTAAATITTVFLPRLRTLKLSTLPELIHTGLNKEYSHGIKGFPFLISLTIFKCHRLRNVFSCSVVRNLEHLQVLETRLCDKMEEIVATLAIATRKGGEEEEQANDETIVFPQLKTLKLVMLLNLRSFCSSRSKEEKEAGEVNLHILPLQPLFNHKVTFPALERLEITRLDHIREIWDNQSVFPAPKEEGSFSQLRYLIVTKCDKLVNVVPANILTRLQNLEALDVKECKSVLSLVEVLNAEDGTSKAATTTITTVFLPRLRTLKLSTLPELIHTGLNKEYSHGIKGFPFLRSLTIFNCHSLRNIFSISMVGNLEQLQVLEIRLCDKMEEIVATLAIATRKGVEEEEQVNDGIIVFPQLRTLKLVMLLNLKSFCSSRSKAEKEAGEVNLHILPLQPLFNHKVAFPSLEILSIDFLENIKERWDNQSESFSQLRSLYVSNCDKLMNYVVPSNMLPRLQNLEELFINISDSVISPVEGGFNVEDKLSTATTTILPQLRKLELYRLPKMMHMGWLNNKEYSGLTALRIMRCNNLRNVFSPSIAKNLVHLQKLEISSCSKMEEIVTTSATTREGGQEANDEFIVFPQLKGLKFNNLLSLQSLCSTRTKEDDKEKVKDEDIPQAQPFFNHKVAFPVLEELHLYYLHSAREVCLGHLPPNSFCKEKVLKVYKCHNITTVVSANSLQRLQNLEKFSLKYCKKVRVVFDLEGLNIGKGQVEVELLFRLRILLLDNLPALNCLWNKDPNGILSFRSLKTVIIQKCGLLRNLFSSSVARTLEQLRILAINSCRVMEEIVAKEGSEQVTDEIVFPRLKFLILANLPKLTSLCSAHFAFNMPSLRKAMLKNCPKMQTFTSGQVSMPKIKIYSNEDQWLWTEDLNKYVQQQQDLKGKGLTMDDEEDDDGFWNGFLLWAMNNADVNNDIDDDEDEDVGNEYSDHDDTSDDGNNDDTSDDGNNVDTSDDESFSSLSFWENPKLP